MSRSHETVVEIAAPPDAVWKAIADAEEIVHWLAPEAKVTPGENGSYFVSWGPGMDWKKRIEIWDPEHRLRLVSDYKGAELVVDYFIEAKEGGAVLRLVNSGFGEGSDWDNEFEGTRKGWPVLFMVLKHGLEHHRGEPTKQISLTQTTSSPEEVWAKLTGGKLDTSSVGNDYALQLPTGEPIHGRIVYLTPGAFFGGTVEEWERALLTILCEHSSFTVAINLYGSMIEQAPAFEQRWRECTQSLSTASLTN